MRVRAVLMISLLAVAQFTLAASPDGDLSGRWHITVTSASHTATAELRLEQRAGRYTGKSGPLDEGGFLSLTYEGSVREGRLHLVASAMSFAKAVGAPSEAGSLALAITKAQLIGKGVLYGVPVSVSAMQPREVSRAPQTHDYAPDSYIINLAGSNEPVLHIRPGDSVRTTTVDANGLDSKRQWRAMPGNAHTGPFYVEGAMPGDTLVVHLTRVRINQNQAEMVCDGLNPNALPASLAPPSEDYCDWLWTLDAAANVARPRTPSPRLKDFRVPLRPMVGSIGVAPPRNAAIPATDVGLHGGNLDYNGATEGATLYFPVFRAGALFSLGDGHAAQGDGEITGQGLETSLAVEFRVELLKGETSRFPWLEDAEYVMFSGIGNSLNEALQAATAGLVDWLGRKYELGTADIAMILGTSLQYDVAEIVDDRPHVVAKLRKEVLSQIRRPKGGT